MIFKNIRFPDEDNIGLLMENVFFKFKTQLLQHISEESLIHLEKLWTSKDRYYHNINHLEKIISNIQFQLVFKELPLVEKHTLLLAAFFHDAVYDPKKNDNEDQSIKFFKQSYIGKDGMMVEKVCDLIKVTKFRKRPNKKLERLFWNADNADFKKGFDQLMKNEKLIQKEYKYIPKEKFREARIKFIESNIGLFNSKVDRDLFKLIEYNKNKLK